VRAVAGRADSPAPLLRQASSLTKIYFCLSCNSYNCFRFLQDLVEETCELVLGERANTTQEPLVRQASALAALPFVPYHADELRRRRKGRPLRSAYAADSGGGEGEEGGEAGEREGDWGAANVRDQQPASNGRGGCALSRGGGSMELASIVEGREDGGYGDEEEGFGGTAESEDVRLLRHMAHS